MIVEHVTYVHLIVDVSSPDPTTCGVATKSSPPLHLMDCILHRLEKTPIVKSGQDDIPDTCTSDYSAITLIQSCEGESVSPHRERFNLGASYVNSIGNFSGGQLWTESNYGHVQGPSSAVTTKARLTVTRHTWTRLDASNVLHAVMPVKGPATQLSSTLQSACMHSEMRIGLY
eukprot:5385974-Amphidinium_carterae.7